MSEWIQWDGGERPVGADVFVEVRTRQGQQEKDIGLKFSWAHYWMDSDIVAYKLADATLINEGTKHDVVNAPSHYALLPGVEVIDVRDALFAKMPIDVPHDVADCWSRSWEYLTRMWGKNKLEDAQKAQFYLDRMIQKMEGGE